MSNKVKSSDLYESNLFGDAEASAKSFITQVELLEKSTKSLSVELAKLHAMQGKSYDDIVRLQQGALELIAKNDLLIAAKKEALIVERELSAGQLRANKAANDAIKAEAKSRVDNARASAIENRENERKERILAKQASTAQRATQNTNTWTKTLSSFQFKFNALGNVAGIMFDRITSGMSNFTRNVIEASKALDGQNRAMKAIFPDSIQLAEAQKKLVDISHNLGINIRQLRGDFINFSASTKGTALEGEKSLNIYTSVSAAMSTLGRSGEETQRALTAISQMIGKTTINAEELKGQLSEAMPRALQVMADALGVNVKKLNEMMANNELMAVDVLPKFAAQLNKTFSLDATKQVDSLAAATARLDNNLTKIADGLNTGGFMKNIANFFEAIVSPITDLISSKPADEFMNIRSELTQMQVKLNDVNTSQSDRVEIINRLQDQYPLYLQNINAETITNDALNKSIDEINVSLLKKIAIQQQQDKIDENTRKQAEYLMKSNAFTKDLIKETEIITRNLGITLNYGIQGNQKYVDLSNRAWDRVNNLSGMSKLSTIAALKSLDFYVAKDNYYRKQFSEANNENKALEKERLEIIERINKELGGKTIEANEKLKKLLKDQRDETIKGNNAISDADSKAAKNRAVLRLKEYEDVKKQTKAVKDLIIDDVADSKRLKIESDLLDKYIQQLNAKLKTLSTDEKIAKHVEKQKKLIDENKKANFKIGKQQNFDFYADNGLSTNKEDYERQMAAYIESRENLAKSRSEQAIKDAETELEIAQKAYEKRKGLGLKEYADLVNAQKKLSDLRAAAIEEDRRAKAEGIAPGGVLRSDDPEYATKMNNILAINEKAAAEEIELKRKTNDELKKLDDEMLANMKGRALDAVEGLAQMYGSYLSARAKYNEKVLEKQYDANQLTQQRLINATAQGSAQAAETLAYEQKRSAEIQAAQKKNQEAQAKQELFLALLSSVAGEMRGGASLPVAITKSIASAAVLRGVAAAYPLSFFDGTDDTGKVGAGEDMDGRGGRLMMIHENEMIFSAAQRVRLGGGSREDVINKVEQFDKVANNNDVLVAEMREVKQAIMDKPAYMGMDLDTLGGIVEYKIQSGNMLRIIKKNLKNI